MKAHAAAVAAKDEAKTKPADNGGGPAFTVGADGLLVLELHRNFLQWQLDRLVLSHDDSILEVDLVIVKLSDSMAPLRECCPGF